MDGAGPQDSLNHVMFGDISASLIQYGAGIRPGAPGYKQVNYQTGSPERPGLGASDASIALRNGFRRSGQLNGQTATLKRHDPSELTGKIYLPMLARR